MSTERVVDRLPTLAEVEQDLERNHRERSILKSLRESLRRAKITEDLSRMCRAAAVTGREVAHA